MEDRISDTIQDHSDRAQGILRFAVRCEACGATWHSETRRFTMAGLSAENESKRVVYDARWVREWEHARALAVTEAMQSFSHCPICKRLSCELCFRICDTIDMCASCAERLNEPCEPLKDKEGRYD